MAENRLNFRRPSTKRHTLRIIEMHMAEKSAGQIAKVTSISRSTVRRVIADVMNNQPKPQEAI